ncbi:hypothetical protein HanHA300_Chr00c0891g0820611 [Helianthus annuus]|nr:hypothetical protein HanHA300_Chr00c0891g0820611 [Helianthus annuus]
MKWVGLLLVWIRQNRSIRKYIQANKYLVLELKNSMSMAGIFSIFLLVTCVHYLGRIPSPIFSTKLNMLEKMEEEEEFDNNEEEEFDNNEEEEFDNNKTKLFSSSIINETSIENCTETAELNKIHDILLPYPNSPENEQKIERSEKKKRKIDSNNGLKFSLNEILTNPKREKKYIGINEIGKKPPRWSYKLINELEQYFKKRRKEQGIMQGLDHQLRTRKFKHIAFLTRSERSFKKSHFKNYNLYRKFNRDSGFISYLEEPDFRRAVIKDSMRVQRRKMEDVIEFWENIPYAQKSRSVLLLAQSIFRRYIKLPLLIIAKNIGRILLRQSPEWYEDFQDWNREIYLKCNYNGLQFSKTEFPKNWLIEGFQIKILYPFHLKPWHRSKLRLSDRDRKQQDDFDSCFLTVLGMETEYPFGPPRKTPSFLNPFLKI